MTRRSRWNLMQFLVAAVLIGSSVAAPAEVVGARTPDAAASQSQTASAQPPTDGTADAGRAAAPGPATAAPASPAAPTGGSIITIPLVVATPKIDGQCTEYGAAVSLPWADGGSVFNSTIYLMYNGSRLYVCLDGVVGSFASRFGRLYLDPQGDGLSYTYAQQDDYALQVVISDSTQSSYHGTGVANGYVTDSTIPPFWTGQAVSSPANGRETVEWAVDYGSFGIKPCETVFRLAGYHHWLSAVGDDYGWPSNHWFDQPRTWQPAILQAAPCGPQSGKIAYVYRGNTGDANSFFSLLTARGYSVTLIPLGAVLATDFSTFDLTIVADDTGSLDQWGIVPMTAAQVNKIRIGGKPTIGLGEGGYAFFGRMGLFIGWPGGWHGPQGTWAKAGTAPANIYTTPSIIPAPTTVYTAPVNSVGIYLKPLPLPADVVPTSLETPPDDHASLILQGCRMLWGGSGNPTAMTLDGQNLFINTVEYMKTFQCANETPVDPACFNFTKTAVPASGTPVTPGSVIVYTLTYSYVNTCPKLPNGVKLVDPLPPNVLFVPNSATDGISPAADGSLTWSVTPSSSAASKSFRVYVPDSACQPDHPPIVNQAQLVIQGSPAVTSTLTTHPVTCPPVGFPNDQPPYAEREVQINPYPFILGHPSKIEVTLTNSSANAITVTVDFMASPDKFGIGIPFNTFASTVVTIPAHGTAVAVGYLTPAASGHYCIQIRVSAPGFAPVYTQRNIDVTEALVAGQADLLNFKVGNPTTSTATIQLVVDNTCPGWTAQITIPPSGTLTNMAPGEVRDAQLSVTPPNPVSLGSGCHIDVQGWIGDHLIGGIRKLDVPPVNLPSDVDPPWEEQEITFRPEPPVAGRAGQVCVFLQNPTGTPKNVTVVFQAADFGAGVPFTTIGTRNVTLPPNSANDYCINWTPVASGTLHRCILVVLQQAGYRDMHSQRNVDLIRFHGVDLRPVQIPFVIGNPDPVSHTLTVTTQLIGLDPFWSVRILPDPPPDLGPGEIMQFTAMLVPAVAAQRSQATAAAMPANPYFGGKSVVQVDVLLDGQRVSGFSVELVPPNLFLPIVRR